MEECGEDHGGEVDEGLCVEPPVDGQPDGRQEQQIAQAQQESRSQQVNLGGGLNRAMIVA